MKKTLIFLYGILSYVVFLASFLYAVGFVGELIVPKSINSGMEVGMTETILINLALLSLFAVQHSGWRDQPSSAGGLGSSQNRWKEALMFY